MNDLKPEDVMPEGAVIDALVLRAPHDAVCRYALALLREKDALIEDYRQELGRARVAHNDANVEIERLEALNSKLLERQSKVLAEAIDEFVERLKSTLIASGIYPVIVKNSIAICFSLFFCEYAARKGEGK